MRTKQPLPKHGGCAISKGRSMITPTLRSLIGVKNLRNADKARATDPWLWLKPTDFFRIVAAKQ